MGMFNLSTYTRGKKVSLYTDFVGAIKFFGIQSQMQDYAKIAAQSNGKMEVHVKT